MAGYFKKYKSEDDGGFISIHFDKILPVNHPARYIQNFIEAIDVSKFEEKYKVGKGKKGRSPNDIRMMLCIIIYGIHQRIYSARKIDYATENYSDFWFFTHKNRISHDKISDFIILHNEEINSIFLETILLAEKNKLLSFESLYQDGFLLKANASRYKNYTKKRLAKKEEKIKEALNGILKNIEKDGVDFLNTEELKLRSELIKIEELKKELNERVKMRSEKDFPSIKKQREENMTINYTDKDCELNRMKDDSFANSYLKVTAIDPKADIIVASSVDGHYDEPHKLLPLILEANKNCESAGKYNKSCADSAFITMGNCIQAESHNIELIGPTKQHENTVRNPEKQKESTGFEYDEKTNCVRCSEGKTLKYCKRYYDWKRGTVISTYRNKKECKNCNKKGKCTKSEYRVVTIDSRFPAQNRALERYKSDEGAALYKKRSHVGETFQGDLKQNGKFLQLFRRGIEKVKIDSKLHDISWNLRRIFAVCGNNLIF
jgi:transposase